MTAVARHVVFGTGAVGLALLDALRGRAVRGISGCRTLHVRYHGRHRRSDVVLQRPTS